MSKASINTRPRTLGWTDQLNGSARCRIAMGELARVCCDWPQIHVCFVPAVRTVDRVATGSQVARVRYDRGLPLPTEHHSDRVGELLALPGVQGKLVPDAHLAALAIEHGLTLCSSDGDFARFPGLKWINPLVA